VKGKLQPTAFFSERVNKPSTRRKDYNNLK